MNNFKKKNDSTWSFLYQCIIHRNDEEFKKLVMEGYHNPNYLKVEECGNQYRGNIVYHIGAYGGSPVGFFAEFIFLLIKLYFATDRGFTPYVYWGEDFLYYEKDGIDNECNAFLHYFEPVSIVQSIDNAAYVIKSTRYDVIDIQNRLEAHGYTINNEYIEALSEMIKKYIRYNKKTLEYLEKGYQELIGDSAALAVHFRGTDYRRQYNDHPVFVTLEQELEKVKEIFATGKYDVIFLATDEQEAVKAFKVEFGDKIKVFEDTWRAGEGDESVAYSHSERENHHYLLGLEVLRDQYMLTRCNGLICGRSNLSLAARMMRKAWYADDYDDLIIIDNQLCHTDRHFCEEKH